MIHAPNVSFSCTGLVWSKKDGWMWRKKIAGRILSVTLKTKEREVGLIRANSLTVRYLQVKQLGLPFEALRETLKASRDVLVDMAMLASLQPLNEGYQKKLDPLPLVGKEDSNSSLKFSNLKIETPNDTKKCHLLSDVLEEWCKEMRSEWKPRTEKLNRRSAEVFIEWCANKSIQHIEDVNKTTISEFKEYLEQRYDAPRSRQDALIKVQALFNFCIDKRDWLQSNPVKGMTYSKVETLNEKTEIAPEAYQQVLSSLYVQNYQGKLKELLTILWNTGMRIGEAIQLRPEDFREVDGVRCISINTENGKTVKCVSSIRTIPVNSHLNELYERMSDLPQGKPVLGWNKNNAAASRVANAFKQFGLNHSTHDFRMSLSNRLRDLEVADSVRYAIMGHANKVTTDRVYKTRAPLMQMLNALEKCC